MSISSAARKKAAGFIDIAVQDIDYVSEFPDVILKLIEASTQRLILLGLMCKGASIVRTGRADGANNLQDDQSWDTLTMLIAVEPFE